MALPSVWLWRLTQRLETLYSQQAPPTCSYCEWPCCLVIDHSCVRCGKRCCDTCNQKQEDQPFRENWHCAECRNDATTYPELFRRK